jgi:Tfp pilus assembly protein PilF
LNPIHQDFDAGDYESAAEHLKIAVESQPRAEGPLPDAWSMLGQAYEELGMEKESARAYRKQAKVDNY